MSKDSKSHTHTHKLGLHLANDEPSDQPKSNSTHWPKQVKAIIACGPFLCRGHVCVCRARTAKVSMTSRDRGTGLVALAKFSEEVASFSIFRGVLASAELVYV